jgi:hypothetical protein
MEGIIQGGWEYVGAAWGISLFVFFAYAARLAWRLRNTPAEKG